MDKERYGAIDGLRAYAAIGVAIMHIKENGYLISGFISEEVIGEFGNFVFLFMVISAFGMCCGYYGRINSNGIKLSDYYGKRFKKVLPFFGLRFVIAVGI